MGNLCTGANRVLSMGPGNLIGPLELIVVVRGGSEDAGAEAQRHRFQFGGSRRSRHLPLSAVMPTFEAFRKGLLVFESTRLRW